MTSEERVRRAITINRAPEDVAAFGCDTAECQAAKRTCASPPRRAVSVIGVYGGFIDAFPMGAVMNRSLRIMTGQCHVHRYMQPLLEHIMAGRIDPTFVITHRMPLADAPKGYETFLHKRENCEKVVLKAS